MKKFKCTYATHPNAECGTDSCPVKNSEGGECYFMGIYDLLFHIATSLYCIEGAIIHGIKPKEPTNGDN